MTPEEVVSLYFVWRGMRERCTKPSSKSYRDYGGRGIKVCDRWLRSFNDFVADMGPRPDGFQIERRDNNGGYCPENCLWVPQQAQALNKRNTRWVTLNGETKTITEWSRITGLQKQLIHYRLKKRWSASRILETPTSSRPNSKLTLPQAQQIRASYPIKTMPSLAREFGVSKKTILNILHGKIFRDDPGLSGDPT